MPSNDLSNPQNRERVMCLVLKMAFAARRFHPVLANPSRCDGPTLFASDDVLSLTLTDLRHDFARHWRKPFPGVLKVGGAAPENHARDLVGARITRRNKEVCAFPPCAWSSRKNPDRIPSSRTEAAQARDHCQRSADFSNICCWNILPTGIPRLTPESFNVRLARLTIPIRTPSLITRLGFFIEDVDEW